MAKTTPPADVLVLGQHPAAYLASILLRSGKSPLNVCHLTIPGEPWPDRLCLINPAFFNLHPDLAKLKKRLTLTGIWGVQFLSEKPDLRSEHKSKTVMGCVGLYSEIRKGLAELAKDAGVKTSNPAKLEVKHVDAHGMELVADGKTVRAKAMLLAGTLSQEDSRRLALPEPWSTEDIREYSYVRLKNARGIQPGAKATIPMSLDLCGQLSWAWMLPGDNEVQLSVERPIRGSKSSTELLQSWGTVLHLHGFLEHDPKIAAIDIMAMQVPAAGALNREGIGNRTLLFGPAGGFFTACLEDIYPNCWSSLFAVDVLKGAINESHLQDALRPYREQWGTTLGEYLRGPQQNLRFLLPLVYRNAVMTSRLAESILLGKSVVR